MKAERFFSIVRRVSSAILLGAGLSVLAFLGTVAWDAFENVLEPRRRAREGVGR